MPASNPALVHKAADRGADAMILDLEDAVAPTDRPAARQALIAHLHERQVDVLVRINSGALDLVRDLEACVRPGLAAVMLAKTEAPERLALVDELVGELEAAVGIKRGSVGTLGLVETLPGLLAAPELAASRGRLLGLALGPEDLALALGGEPDAELLIEPARQLAWAARAASLVAVGFSGTISNFTDLPRLRQDIVLARRLGYTAAMFIHPAQFKACHEAFSVSAVEAEQAQRVVKVFAAAERAGEVVCALDGQMIDRPVVLRARETLARWERQNRRPGTKARQDPARLRRVGTIRSNRSVTSLTSSRANNTRSNRSLRATST